MKVLGSKPVKIIGAIDDTLEKYARSVIESGVPLNTAESTQWFNRAVCTILHREWPFQTELCTFPSGTNIPVHRHPNVSTVEYLVTGSLDLIIDERPTTSRVPIQLLDRLAFRINLAEPHSVEIGNEGASFLSIQEWHEDTDLDHIGHNWEGTTYSSDQAERLHARAD
ncbi:MAG: hypothetical protein P8R39_11455 [Alphaproteobacteria bacterium]|nr:hypothetical protein [Alphaproteobacteria bacterium]